MESNVARLAWDAARSGNGATPEAERKRRFEALTLPHAAALYRIAHSLLGNPIEAEALTREAFVRAYRAFADFQGDDGRAWLLTFGRAVFLEKYRQHERSNRATRDSGSTPSWPGSRLVVARTPGAEREAAPRIDNASRR
jgi:RNA polymerase sigma-70 factor (ECF subfamily)